jgi:hypothetical protein
MPQDCGPKATKAPNGIVRPITGPRVNRVQKEANEATTAQSWYQPQIATDAASMTCTTKGELHPTLSTPTKQQGVLPP